MRRNLFRVGALSLAVFGLTAASASAITPTQTIVGEVGGKATPKFDKKKFKATSVEVTTETADADNPAGMPPKATKGLVKFDKQDVKFNTKAVPGCDPNTIENTSTQTALASCGSSKVGSGSAIAALPFGVGGTRQDFPAVVEAFNRSDAKGILLHSRVDSLGTTVVLKGALSGANLSIDIPPLGGGTGAIAKFTSKIKKKNFVQARCKSKTIHYTGTFNYSDAVPATGKDTQKCKRK